MSSFSEQVMRPMVVPDPEYLRWRDIADAVYSDGFRERFDYADAAGPRVSVRYQPSASTLVGNIQARGLKPWFAYQLKLVGVEVLAGPGQRANAGDAATWSSYQLGRLGRWWCEECQWNVADREVRSHLRQGHRVRGYLLFDWLVTDGDGNCDHDFSLDRSLHVVWRVGQRERGPHDSAPRWYQVQRGPTGYPAEQVGTSEQVALYGEWEPTRPRMGSAALPVGDYYVRLNLTEESFHANLKEELQYGGRWAWVLHSDLRFTVGEEEAAAEMSEPNRRASLPRRRAGLISLFRQRQPDPGRGDR